MTTPTTFAETTRIVRTHRAAAEVPRLDLYAPIHKALRSFMTDTLGRVGRMDLTDAADTASALGQFEALLDQCLRHIEHENAFMHAALDARRPGAAQRTAEDHLDHLESIDTLRGELAAFRRAPDGERPALALRLYRHLALFVAENFQHMHHEETVNNAALWAAYSDAEIAALHERLLATIPPQENLQIARWMVPALPPVDRAAVLNHAKAGMPSEAFEHVVGHVREHLDDVAWAKLAPAIGVPQQPGSAAFR